ncbi:MAG: hypothetical protein EA369_01530 [Bradymonadales bacterium]|nr:MAG: hypothetical protein EA369_01530 [Bradymonadales bacterium]
MSVFGVLSIWLGIQALEAQDRVPVLECKEATQLGQELREPLSEIFRLLSDQSNLVVLAALDEISQERREALAFRYDSIKTQVSRKLEGEHFLDAAGQVHQVLSSPFSFELQFQPYGEAAMRRRIELGLSGLGDIYQLELKLKPDAFSVLPIILNSVAMGISSNHGQPVATEDLYVIMDRFHKRTGVLVRRLDEDSIKLESERAFRIIAPPGLFAETKLNIHVKDPSLSYKNSNINSVEEATDSIYSLAAARMQVAERLFQIQQIGLLCLAEPETP